MGANIGCMPRTNQLAESLAPNVGEDNLTRGPMTEQPWPRREAVEKHGSAKGPDDERGSQLYQVDAGCRRLQRRHSHGRLPGLQELDKGIVMKYPPVHQIIGGKKHIRRSGSFELGYRYYCGLFDGTKRDIYLGRLWEPDIDESFCRRCVALWSSKEYPPVH